MTPYSNIYSVIPSPAMVMVLTGRGTVSEKCTWGIPMVNPRPWIYHVVRHLVPAQFKAYPISGPTPAEGALDISCCKASRPSLIKGISYIWADPS